MSRFIFISVACFLLTGCVGMQSERRLFFPHMDEHVPARFASLDAPAGSAPVMRFHSDDDDSWADAMLERHPWLYLVLGGISLSAIGYIIRVGMKEE